MYEFSIADRETGGCLQALGGSKCGSSTISRSMEKNIPLLFVGVIPPAAAIAVAAAILKDY